MSLITKIAQLIIGNGDSVAKPIEAFGDAVDKIWTNEEEKLQAMAVLQKLEQNPMEWQNVLNKIEAQSKSFLKSGWRPILGWICDISVGLYYIPQFFLAAVFYSIAFFKTGQLDYPLQDVSGLFELVLILLGNGAIRTVEKLSRITK